MTPFLSERKAPSTWGTVKADIRERFIAKYKSPDLCHLVADHPFLIPRSNPWRR